MLRHWLERNLTMLRDNPARLVVLPETTIPLLVDDLPPGYLDAVRRHCCGQWSGCGSRYLHPRWRRAHLQRGDQPRSVALRALRQAALWCPSASIRRRCSGGSTDLVNIPMADQTRGAERQPPLHLAGQKVAMNICYEDVFGEELIRSLPEATLMLNISNLAWYGDSWAQPQHLQIARLRALETGRPMLRATNTGMTAVVRCRMAVCLRCCRLSRLAALHAEVRGYQGLTPYARWGNWPAAGAWPC